MAAGGYATVAPATLLALYGIMLLIVSGQQVQLVRRGHRVLHYKSLFNLFVMVWMGLRVAFWLVDLTSADLPELLADLIFWTPHTAMFLTFATLALFLAKVARGPAWSGALRRRYLWAYGVVAAVNVASTVAFSVLDAQADALLDDAAQAAIQDAESVETAVLFLLLAGGFACVRGGVWRRLCARGGAEGGEEGRGTRAAPPGAG